MIKNKKTYLWFLLASLVLLVFSFSAHAGEEKVLGDEWALVRMAGDDAGFVHSKVFQIDEGSAIFYRTTHNSEVNIKRFGQVTSVSVEGWVLEDHQGRILKMHQKSILSGNKILYDLEVVKNKASMSVTTMGTPRKIVLDWFDDVRGPMGAWFCRKKNGGEPGTRFSYKTFNFDFSKVATVTIEVLGPEETELLDGEKATYTKALSTQDVLLGVNTYEWWNNNYDIMKTSLKIMGIQMEIFRTTKERIQARGEAELKADLIMESMARANLNLPRPYRLDSILYRFKTRNPDFRIPGGLDRFRQEVRENDGQTATVFIQAKVPRKSQKRPLMNPVPELTEYLEPNAFIQSDYPKLKAKALEVVGEETDAWKAACLLERFVHDYIKDKNMLTGFATAAEVMENPRGDCSEHGVLLAALCRAAGIPARLVLGYMYIGGIFGGHMWAEVWIAGDWYPIDGVMGISRVGPTHITFSTTSLHKGGLGDAFTSLVQGLGNLEITILEFTRGDKTVKVGKRFKDYVIDGNKYTNTLFGISITKPEEYEFDNYERDFSRPDFTLVEIKGKSKAELTALPIFFSFTVENLKQQAARDGFKFLSEFQQKVCGHPASVFILERNSKTFRLLAVILEDTCYLFRMQIKDKDRDLVDFEMMVKSIKFTN
jgi:hypothetical protein